MANTAKTVTELLACNNPQLTDVLMISSNVAGNTESLHVSVDDLFSNASANVIACSVLNITSNTTPANNTDPPVDANNTIWSDGSYLYHYNGTTIKRVALTDF